MSFFKDQNNEYNFNNKQYTNMTDATFVLNRFC